MIVSIIDNGAGSIAVCALHALPTTCSTSGNCESILFVCMRYSMTAGSETSGMVMGIYIMAHSSSGGINSDPSVPANTHQTRTSHHVRESVIFFRLSAAVSNMLYFFCIRARRVMSSS